MSRFEKYRAVAAGGAIGFSVDRPTRPNNSAICRFATPGLTITTLPMQIASEKGMDKEEGFTAAFTNTTGSVAIKAMLAGDFDLTLSVGGSLTAAVSGAPTKVIYVHVAEPLYFLYARESVTPT